MIKRILEMDDVRVGMYITILKGKMELVGKMSNNLEPLFKENNSYKGNILEVKSIDFPYIAITAYREGPTKISTRNDFLDIREIEIMSLSKDYIINLIPDFKFNEDNFWDDIDENIIEKTDVDIEEIFKNI